MSARLASPLLAIAVLVSALAVVLARHESRRLFVELAELERLRDALDEEWGRLQLEEATWSTHGRIEELARSRLGMHQPRDPKMIFLP